MDEVPRGTQHFSYNNTHLPKQTNKEQTKAQKETNQFNNCRVLKGTSIKEKCKKEKSHDELHATHR